MKKNIIAILSILFVAVVVAGLYGWYHSNNKPVSSNNIDEDSRIVKPEEIVIQDYEELSGAILNHPQMDSGIDTTVSTNDTGDSITIYKVDDLIITYTEYNGGADQNSIIIENTEGIELYNNTEVKTLIGKDLIKIKPVISDNKLYFAAYVGGCYHISETEQMPYILYQYVDLKNDVMQNDLQTIRAYTEGYILECE